ncbi:Linoleate 13S-lipoxygenase [Handroanthus impetiginosus]|uniref:Linoleate 13S-lipoxygenase n=1 Tax=Handroanthus impetiginosus TaxID=429701 RepID=A0A2G9HBC6_9LAMI|nr:Linoleate 13S-lipoxygenase [Handroanthus impetiginosus]
MLKHNLIKSHSSTSQIIFFPHIGKLPFISGGKNAKNSLSPSSKSTKFCVLRHRVSRPGSIKAVLTGTEKSTSVKAVVTVLQTVGGALSHLGLTRGLDDIADVLGRTLLVELVAAELDPSK